MLLHILTQKRNLAKDSFFVLKYVVAYYFKRGERRESWFRI